MNLSNFTHSIEHRTRWDSFLCRTVWNGRIRCIGYVRGHFEAAVDVGSGHLPIEIKGKRRWNARSSFIIKQNEVIIECNTKYCKCFHYGIITYTWKISKLYMFAMYRIHTLTCTGYSGKYRNHFFVRNDEERRLQRLDWIILYCIILYYTQYAILFMRNEKNAPGLLNP